MRLSAVDDLLIGLSNELHVGGIAGQTHLHALLEDLGGMLQEIGRQYPEWNPEARQQGVLMLERTRNLLERTSQVIGVMQGWAGQRLADLESGSGYQRAPGRETGGRYRRQPSHGSALEGAVG